MKQKNAAGLLQRLTMGVVRGLTDRVFYIRGTKVLACGLLCSEVRGQPRADMIAMCLGILQAQPSLWDLGALPTPPLALCTIDLASLYQLM